MIGARFFGRLFPDMVALDLGTANTRISSRRHGAVVVDEPSVIALDERTGKVVAAGSEARRYIGRTPHNIRVVRPLRDGVIADFDAAQSLVAWCLHLFTKRTGVSRPCIAVSIPTGVTPVERRAVVEAVKQAGATVRHLVEMPLASALGAGLDIEQPKGNMVLDVGGGVSGVALISLSHIAFAESIPTGGDDLTLAIQRHFRDRFRLVIGENMAESVKIGVAEAVPNGEPRIMCVSGKRLVDGAPVTFEVSGEDIMEPVSDCLAAVTVMIRAALERTPPELAADIFEHGICMTGGGTLLRGFGAYIRRETGIDTTHDPSPLTTNVRGAGLFSGLRH